MKTKSKIAIAACAATMALFGVLACGENTEDIDPDNKPTYSFAPAVRPKAEPDAGIKIDGVLDEAWYRADGLRTLNVADVNNESRADISLSVWFGEKGVYFGIDEQENTPLYVNPDRGSYLNSCIEVYVAPADATRMSDPRVCEIDLSPSGQMTFKKRYAGGDEAVFAPLKTTDDIMARYAAVTKGELNTFDCTGFCCELFIPYGFFEYLGYDAEVIPDGELLINIAHITSYNYEGEDWQADRRWYMLGAQLDDGEWDNTQGWFHADKNGIKLYDLTLASLDEERGSLYERNGYTHAVADNSVTVRIKEEEGAQISSLLVNGVERIDDVVYDGNGRADYIKLGRTQGDITVIADFVAAGGERVACDTVVKGERLGKVSLLADREVTVIGAGVAETQTTDGEGRVSFSLPKGVYTVRSGGYFKKVAVTADGLEDELTLGYTMFTPGCSDWDLSEAAESDGIYDGRITALKNEYGYATFTDKLGSGAVSVTLGYSKDGISSTRQGLRFLTADNKYISFEINAENGGVGLQSCPSCPFAEVEITPLFTNWAMASIPEYLAKRYVEGSVTMTVTRSMADGSFKVFIDGIAVYSCSFPEFEGVEAKVQLIKWEGAGFIYDYKLYEDSEGVYLDTSGVGEGGSVRLKGVSTVCGAATLIITPDAGHELESMTVNGIDVTEAARSGEYSFECCPWQKLTVKASFRVAEGDRSNE